MGDLTPVRIYTGHCRAEKRVPNTVGNVSDVEEIMTNFTEAVNSDEF